MADDKTGLLSGGGTTKPAASTTTSTSALYHDSSQSPTTRFLQLAFVVTVVLMVLVTIILSIVRGVEVGGAGAMYFMMGVSLLGLVAVEIVLILLIRKDELPTGKTWFLYFVGFCVILEAIFTDVLLYQN